MNPVSGLHHMSAPEGVNGLPSGKHDLVAASRVVRNEVCDVVDAVLWGMFVAGTKAGGPDLSRQGLFVRGVSSKTAHLMHDVLLHHGGRRAAMLCGANRVLASVDERTLYVTHTRVSRVLCFSTSARVYIGSVPDFVACWATGSARKELDQPTSLKWRISSRSSSARVCTQHASGCRIICNVLSKDGTICAAACQYNKRTHLVALRSRSSL